MTTADFHHELAAMRARYRRGLVDRMAEIRRWADAWLDTADPAAAQRLTRGLHRLAGSAGTFQFEAVGAAARAAEARVRAIAGTRKSPAAPEVVGALEALEARVAAELGGPSAVVQAGPGVASADLDPLETAPEGTESRLVGRRRRDDRPVVHFPTAAGEARFGLALREARFRTEVLERADGPSPWTLVAPQAELRDYAGLPPRHTVALLGSESFEDRLAAARAGAQTVLVEPIDDEALVEVLEELRDADDVRRPRILVVDDDAQTARGLAQILEGERMDVRWVVQARDVLPAVREHRPDVLLTDLRMPHCDGFELAAIVRQDPSLISLPVVFMSADETAVREAAVRHDGDAFLPKNHSLDDFVRLIRAKARRARRLEASMTTDSMTGLLRHAVFKERLATEVARCQRQTEVMACVMLDIDHFKGINDSQGHATGDRVIKGLARLLRRRLRTTDLVGRYGGEEFALGLVNTPPERARELVDDLRQRFARMTFSGPSGPLRATFSAGIATYPDCDSRDELLMAADEALYAAKQAGRNRVELYSSLSHRAASA